MTTKKKKFIPLENAKLEVEITSRRIGLLHLAYAKTLVKEFGEKRGKEIIVKAIKYYGKLIGEKVREDVKAQDLESTPKNYGAGKARNLPKFGMHEKKEQIEVENEKRIRSYGCAMAKIWREYGEEELGSLYCYIDISKYMFYNPNYKMIHTKTMPVSGSDYCELAVRHTTEKERKDFFSEDKDWLYMDGEITKKEGGK